MLCIKQSIAQDWPCGPAATYNINIPNNNVYLSENSVAVHPLYPNIILSANNYNPGGSLGVSAYVSTNWGVNWNSPFSNGIFDPNSRYDPAAAIDLNGWMYVSYIGSGDQIKVARSTDMGNNWSIATVSGNADKDHLKIDNSCSSPYRGRLYCAWSDGGKIKVSYSTNSGTNWSTPALMPPGSFDLGVNIATDNSGVVYVVWALHNTINNTWSVLRFTKSTNGGINWSSPPSTISLQYTANRYLAGAGPSMTVNMQDNAIYLVYSGYVVPNPYDVYIKKSTDGGSTWSAETRVNQVQAGDQTFPWISCDPMTGYLACIYYDRRVVEKHTYMSISTNTGASWCDMKISTLPWTGGGTGSGNDYIGIEFNKGIIYPIWTDTRGDNNYRSYTYPFEVIAKDLTIQNQVYNGNQLIQSANTITATNVTINSGANVTFQTVKSITLEPGFYTNDNCIFTADVFHCQGYNEPENIVQNNQVKLKETDNTIPLEFSLSQNYPNPFNPTTSIKYSLKQDSWVKIIIYNILGQEVKRLVDGYIYAGYSTVVWDGTNNYGSQVSSGIYFCKLRTGDFIDQKKMVVIR